MRTIVHLSDLHFGRVNPVVVDVVRDTVRRLEPDLVAVSGDFTQRARSKQFSEARAFLESLPRPQLIVPGNHDVPLHNVFARFFNPLGGYRHHMTDDLRPHYIDHEIAVIGTDTTRSFTIGGGGIRRRELRRIRELMKQADRSAVTILVAHHPFDEPHAGAAFGRARPGAEAVEQLAADGIDVFLTGHLHVTFAGPTAKRYRIGGRSAIVVEAGTATSTRVRGEPNAFNVLRIERQAIAVEHLVWNAASRAFVRGEVQRFTHSPDGWTPLSLDNQ
ncbi:MAG TPA: metallophosphoesterase [Vicinamibacterales bacterium]|jgi:3',5'-cyclic AMP phosphodiesterase CpdA|nr:metallophosphoesterase [Vicinamibacterales bacterium]